MFSGGVDPDNHPWRGFRHDVVWYEDGMNDAPKRGKSAKAEPSPAAPNEAAPEQRVIVDNHHSQGGLHGLRRWRAPELGQRKHCAYRHALPGAALKLHRAAG